MKRIMINAIVTPNDESVTLENLQDALRHLGSAYFTFAAEVELSGIEGLAKEVWLYVSSDDAEPYIQVAGSGETEGKALSDEEVDQLRGHGVCTDFRAEYPRADRYGAPSYANDDEFAAGVVGNHLFKVNADGLTVHAEDRRDDGCEQIWLKLVMPE
jgi:hypothetical protein